MQVPGVNYTKKFAPVASDSMTWLILAITLWHHDKGWRYKSINIEPAFLEGLIEEPIILNGPQSWSNWVTLLRMTFRQSASDYASPFMVMLMPLFNFIGPMPIISSIILE